MRILYVFLCCIAFLFSCGEASEDMYSQKQGIFLQTIERKGQQRMQKNLKQWKEHYALEK